MIAIHEQIRRDLRHAARALRRMPGLAAVVVLSLGVGIGVNVVVLSWIQAMLLRPLPGVRDAGAFLLVEPVEEGGTYPGASWREYLDLRERVPSFRDLVASRSAPLNLGEAGRTERAYGQLVSGNFFDALGLRPALGRFIRPEEAARPGGEPVAVVSHGFWQSRLAGDPAALGRSIRLNEREVTVVGVAPPGFQGTTVGLQFDVWLPATMAPVLLAGSRELDDRGARGYALIGRLREGGTRERAQSEVGALMRELAVAYPRSNANVAAEVHTFWDAPRGPRRFMGPALITLQGIMLLLLLAVCANAANLLLARAATRRREIAVRRALGAGAARIASLLLTESLLLALAGAVLGALIAVWGTGALRAVPMPRGMPFRFQTTVDGLGLAAAAGLALVGAVAVGLAPALQLARVDPGAELRGDRASPRAGRLRGALVGAEVALALLVLIVAAIFFRNLRETRDTDPGFRREGVLLAAYDLSGRQTDAAYARTFARRVLERLAERPEVEAAAVANAVPLDIHGLPLRAFALEGRARADAAQDRALSLTVTPDYFRALDIPLRAGRGFASLADTAAPPQAIVNEEFARRFADGEPLGRRITAGGREYTIVGVVRTTTYDQFGESPKPMVYYSYRDRPASYGQVHVRTRPGAEAAVTAALRAAVAELDPALPVYDVRTLADHVDRNLVFRRIPARMFVVLGPLLLLLAAIGIYAVVAYSVARRTAEIGVRLALGATAGRVVAQIVGGAMRPVAQGAAAGWVLAFLVYIHAQNGRPLDPAIFVGVPVLLLAVAALASWLPARRAASVDPTVALRAE
ncbi:MAG: ADOP family duplicated permease [Gemmatimonadaceae bacterium]